jgi:hypothetical protein
MSKELHIVFVASPAKKTAGKKAAAKKPSATTKKAASAKKVTAKKPAPAKKTAAVKKPSAAVKTPKKTVKKAVAAPVKKEVPKKALKNASADKKLVATLSRADDIYLTKTKIAVKTVASDARGRLTESTRYLPKNATTVRAAEEIHGRLRRGR